MVVAGVSFGAWHNIQSRTVVEILQEEDINEETRHCRLWLEFYSQDTSKNKHVTSGYCYEL